MAYTTSAEEERDYDIEWKTLNMSNWQSTNSRKRRSIFARTSRLISHGEEAPLTPRYRKRRNTDTSSNVGSYQQMATGRKSSLRRRKQKKTTLTGSPIYYVSPDALLPDGSVISCLDRWEHFTPSELRGFPVLGKLVTYGGGGYVANIGYNEETGWTVTADLHAHNWLDKQSRAAFVEFTVYNANVNLFATAFLYIETLPTGGAFPWADFQVFNGYRYSAANGLQTLWAELVFICFIIYFSVREIRKLIKQKGEYFKSFFNLIELLLMPLYIIMFVLIIARWLTTSANIKTFTENPKDFVSFQYTTAADSALQGKNSLPPILNNYIVGKIVIRCK